MKGGRQKRVELMFLATTLQVIWYVLAKLAVLWVGLLILRGAAQYSSSKIPPPFDADIERLRNARKWRYGVSLVTALLGGTLIIAASCSLLFDVYNPAG